MKPILIGICVAVVILAAFALYRSRHTGERLNVEPHAAEVIDKAKKQK